MKRFLFASAFVLVAALAFVGCADDDNDGSVPATAVVLDVESKTLGVGETLQLTATPAPSDTTDPVVWSSDEETVATVSETGLVTAVAPGTAVIKAVCGSVSATCTIEVAEPAAEYDIISFEAEEGMKDFVGNAVTLGDVKLDGGVNEGLYHNLFCAKKYAEEYGDPDNFNGLTFDNPLFSTADEHVWFGSFYSDCTGWGVGQMDSWGGFVLSQSYNTTASSSSYADQFSVYAESGANSSKVFAAAYCFRSMVGGTYSNPVIEFVEPRTVAYLHMAPSTMFYTYYKYDFTAAKDRTCGFRITGSLNGESTGTVDVMLVKNSTVEAGWVKVDLSSLGQVDKLTFAPEGINPNVDLDPVYFCLDEIALVKE